MNNIPDGFDEEDVEPFESDMLRLTHYPEHGQRPSVFEIIFSEPELFAYDTSNKDWWEYDILPEMQTWLNEHAPRHYVTIDRGDFGDGPPSARIELLEEAAADAFFEKFNKRQTSWVLTQSGFDKMMGQNISGE